MVRKRPGAVPSPPSCIIRALSGCYQGVIREPPLPPASLGSCQGLWGWGGGGPGLAWAGPFQGNFFLGWKGDVSCWGCHHGLRSILSSRPARSELAMAYHSFLLEPISCHAWNKDRTRKYRPRPHRDLLTPGPKSPNPQGIIKHTGVGTGTPHP